jgi:hypothetical protein
MASISGDLLVLRFLEILHPFFQKNDLNIGWSARFELQKKSSYLEEWSSVGSQFLSFSVVLLTWDFVPQQFPKTWKLFFLSSHLFPARLVLWQYSMHVFCYLFWKHMSHFLLLPSSSSCFHLFGRPILFNQYVLHVLHFLSFSCLMKRSPVSYGALSCSIEYYLLLYFCKCFKCLFYF